jgi:hypothetical protein
MLCYGGWRTLDDSLFRHNRTRSYFGIYTVDDYGNGAYRMLTHGTTMHGVQFLRPELRRLPTTYYARRSGIGLALQNADHLYGPHARIGVVGLGTGTLSCYARPGQDWRFFEIDPAIADLSTRTGTFTFVHDCAPRAHIVLGDARLALARQPKGGLDMLALDAFSSDAIPMHLLTREAFQVYAQALQPNGMLLVHISNRYVSLLPVVAAAARSGHWWAVMMDFKPDLVEINEQASRSVWIAMSRNDQKIAELMLASFSGGEWTLVAPRRGFDAWTDDHASILPLLRLRAFGSWFGS